MKPEYTEHPSLCSATQIFTYTILLFEVGAWNTWMGVCVTSCVPSTNLPH